MKKYLIILFFCFINLSFFGQTRLRSPFKLNDYKKLKTEYIANSNKEEFILDNNYYFKNKIDSLTKMHIENDSIKFLSKKKIKYFYNKRLDVLVILTNDGLGIVFWFLEKTDREFVGNGKFLNDNLYWNETGKLHQKNYFSLPNYIQIGISKHYDEKGKLIFCANWKRDFRLSIEEAKKISDKYLIDYLEEYSKKTGNISDIQIKKIVENQLIENQPKISKNIDAKKNSFWIISYYDLKTTLDISYIRIKFYDKSLELISIKDN